MAVSCYIFGMVPTTNEVDELFPKTWDDPAGSVHVITVFFPKLLQRHLFLTRNPIQVQRDKRRQHAQAANPVLEQQRLSDPL